MRAAPARETSARRKRRKRQRLWKAWSHINFRSYSDGPNGPEVLACSCSYKWQGGGRHRITSRTRMVNAGSGSLGRRKWSTSWRVDPDGKNPGVALEIGVSGKDRPTTRVRDGTNQHIGNGDRHALTPALVTEQCSNLIVFRSCWLIRKSSKNLAEFRELFAASNSGEQFLTNKADDFCPALVNECRKLGYDGFFRGAEVTRSAAECQGPP